MTCRLLLSKLEHSIVLCSAKTRRWASGARLECCVALEFTAERGKVTCTFVCTVAVCRGLPASDFVGVVR